MTTRQMPWMRTLHACAIAVLAGACSSAPPPLDSIGEGYVRAALQLAQHDPDLVEAFRGSDSLIPGPRVPVASIAADVRVLRAGIDRHADVVGSHIEKARIDYLDNQLRALDFATGRLLGRATSIDEQARDEFAVAFSQPDPEVTRRTLAEVDRLLPGSGTTSERVTKFRARLTIPDDRKQAVMQIAIDACRDAAAPVIDLPDNEGVEVRFHKNMPWDAFARYAGNHHTTIEINDMGPLDMPRALRLACHEGHAGHHAQHLLIDRLFAERQWPELQLTPAFGRHLLLMEGAAEVGADLALPAERRAQLYRARLFPVASLDPAAIDTLVRLEDLLPLLLPVVTEVGRQYLDSRIAREQAVDRLSNEALISNPEGTLAFIERRRARALVYGEGGRIMYSMMPARNLAGLRDLFRSAAAVQ
jgi:hypothetical protein